MKSVSAIIAIILILMIVVALASLFYMFSSSLFTSITQTGTSSIARVTETLSSCMKIDGLYQNKLYLRNCGNGVITSNTTNIYIDDSILNFSMAPDKINNGELATVSMSIWSLSIGYHKLKISSPSNEITRNVEVYSADSNNVLDLRFEEGSGITTYDSSSYNNDGTLENSPTWTSGKFGKALSFNGNNQYVGVWDSQSLRLRDAIQVEAWINTSDMNGVRMSISNRFSGSLDSESGWLFFITEQGRLRLHIGDGSSFAEATGTSDLRDEKWHYVIGNYNKSIIQVFVDGNLEGFTSYTGNIWNDTSATGEYGLNVARRCDICGGSSGSLFNGTIDEVKIYGEAPYPFKTMSLRLK